MGGIADSGTRITLLGRLRRDPTHQGAWREFVDLYGPKIMAWCQRWNLQEADAEDVTQVILIKLAEKLRDFTYDPSKSFRLAEDRGPARVQRLPTEQAPTGFGQRRQPGCRALAGGRGPR